MFRYLWRFKAIFFGLMAAFAIGFYYHPIFASLALGLVVFVRLSKIHSYLVLADLADRAAMKHVRVLATKRIHMLSPDEYGSISEEAWDKHLNAFIKKVLLPEFQKKKVDYLLTEDAPRQLKRLRKRMNRIVDRYHPLTQPAGEGEALMTGREYEVLCKQILEEAGWTVILTPGSGDQGADIIAEKDGIRVVIQCKLYNGSVGNKAVQEAFAAARFQDAHYAVVATNSIFTKSARQLAHKNGVVLMHHEDLAGLDASLRGSEEPRP